MAKSKSTGDSARKLTFGKRKKGSPKKSYNKHTPRPKKYRGQGKQARQAIIKLVIVTFLITLFIQKNNIFNRNLKNLNLNFKYKKDRYGTTNYY